LNSTGHRPTLARGKIKSVKTYSKLYSKNEKSKMSKTVNKEINAGVHANIGMDFQKHCALFLFLEKYHEMIDTRYFIILEHYDDIVFGYLDSNERVEIIETYQSKKSSNEWKLSQLYEIIKKIIENALILRTDEIEKTNEYTQHHYFVTNESITLKVTEAKVDYVKYVNESDSLVEFTSLPKPIQKNIKKKLLSEYNFTDDETSELENISLKYIDLSKKSISQKEQLEGMFRTVFGDSVIDHRAAVDTLLYYFHNVENTLNQGNCAKLSDNSKRIESTLINEVIGVLTTKKKAFDLWRKKADKISNIMKIPVFEQKNFKLHFENSFDNFKDFTATEHQKIYKYVLSKVSELRNFYSDMECLEFLQENIRDSISSQLTDIQIKAAVFAAYIEIKETQYDQL